VARLEKAIDDAREREFERQLRQAKRQRQLALAQRDAEADDRVE
jgi:hypothetical protein